MRVNLYYCKVHDVIKYYRSFVGTLAISYIVNLDNTWLSEHQVTEAVSLESAERKLQFNFQTAREVLLKII